MHAPKVVPHVEQRDLMHMIVDLLAKAIRQPGKPTHAHSHIQILPFDVAGADVRPLGIATHSDSFSAKTLRRAVALVSLRIVAVDLHKLREVDILSKLLRDSIQVHLMAIRGQLDAIRQTRGNILKKLRCTPGVPPSAKPAQHQLAISVDCSKGPNVTSKAYTLPHLRRGVLVLGIAEAPDLIDLDALGRHVANNGVLKTGACGTNFLKEPDDSSLSHGQSCGRWS